MKQTWLDKEHKPSNFFPLRGNTMKYQVSIRQEMKRQVYTVQQPKLKHYFKSLTGKQQKEKTKKKKKKENEKKPHREILPPRWRIFGGAQHRLVAQTSRWNIALSSSGTCKKKDYLITWKILGIEKKIFSLKY